VKRANKGSDAGKEISSDDYGFASRFHRFENMLIFRAERFMPGSQRSARWSTNQQIKRGSVPWFLCERVAAMLSERRHDDHCSAQNMREHDV